eukprot:m.71521 g.71521  ORF g.71521 m.71521 type:complete len:1136 (+) comp12297_c0_seq8:49-3456(+)
MDALVATLASVTAEDVPEMATPVIRSVTEHTEADLIAAMNDMMSGDKVIHAVLAWKLPKPYSRCLRVLEHAGLSLSETADLELQAFYFNDSDEEVDSGDDEANGIGGNDQQTFPVAAASNGLASDDDWSMDVDESRRSSVRYPLSQDQESSIVETRLEMSDAELRRVPVSRTRTHTRTLGKLAMPLPGVDDSDDDSTRESSRLCCTGKRKRTRKAQLKEEDTNALKLLIEKAEDRMCYEHNLEGKKWREIVSTSTDEHELNEANHKLRTEAVLLQREVDPTSGVVFVKIHVPFAALCAQAEELQLLLPLKEGMDERERAKRRQERARRDNRPPLLSWRGRKRKRNAVHPRQVAVENAAQSFSRAQQKVKATSIALLDDDEYWATFTVAHGSKFLHFDEPERFFTPAQTARMVRHLMLKIPYADKPTVSKPAQPSADDSDFDSDQDSLDQEIIVNANSGFANLLHSNRYIAAYSLHDTSANKSMQRMSLTRAHMSTSSLSAAVLAAEAQPRPKSPINAESSGWRYLRKTWGMYRTCGKKQPINAIKDYFGEQIAFYFLWLGFYTKWLIAPTVLGLLVFGVGFALKKNRPDVEEYCSANLTMCALCSTCDKWTISDSCDYYELSYLFDNTATMVYALFISIWSTLFIEFWKRTQVRAASKWRVVNFEETEPQRPQFLATDIQPDAITGTLKPYFPVGRRRRRYVTSVASIAIMLAIVLLSVFGIVAVRAVLRSKFFTSDKEGIQRNASLLVSVLSAAMSLVIIVLVGQAYRRLAVQLTRWENHEKESEYDRALAVKVFMFEFVNNFASIFFVAFGKQVVAGYPGNRGTLFGVRIDDCPEYGCLLELTIQLIIIMGGKIVINNTQEVVVPLILRGLRNWNLGIKTKSMTQAAEADTVAIVIPGDTDGEGGGQRVKILSRDEVTTIASALPWVVQLSLTNYPGLLYEYMEIILQFGFVTLFVASFPLAPLFALINNVIEIRLDAVKHLTMFKRGFGRSAENIAPWQDLLQWMSIAGVLTNACVVAFTSRLIPRWVYVLKETNLVGFINASHSLSTVTSGDDNEMNCYYQGFRDTDGDLSKLFFEIMLARVVFVLVFEHLVFGAKLLLAMIIYDVPADVLLKEKREEFRAKQALDAALIT